MLEQGIEAENAPEGPGSSPVTRNTIDMMVEFAYLESDTYHGSLTEWREALERSHVSRLERSGKGESKEPIGSKGSESGKAKRSRKDQKAAAGKRRRGAR